MIGLGIFGSAAAYFLARRGVSVAGFDALGRAHDFGSSHGTTRMTRLAYFESPQYVPLLRRSLELWRQLEAESSRTLTNLNGGLYIGTPQCALVSGSLQSARAHDLAHEFLSAAEIRSRFPAFSLPANFFGVYEKNTAGIIYAEAVLNTYRDLALGQGASLSFETPVIGWNATASGAKVTLAGGASVEADALVIAAGPWMRQVLATVELPLRVVRVYTAYFKPDDPARFGSKQMPIYCLSDEDGFFYGFPWQHSKGMKVGCHRNEEMMTLSAGGTDWKPEQCDRNVSAPEIANLERKLQRYLPGSAQAHASSSTCLYTMTPDEHFIIDRLPAAPQVVYASACSGHGFKFAPVIGEVLADLATTGQTRQAIEFLSARRFASGCVS